MRQGKGTGDFEVYIHNLQQALATATAGAQLGAKAPGTRAGRTLIHNPYGTTVAQMGILRLRTINTSTQ